jgi:diguanylate cyclase (GGDEF)-like protein
MRSEKQSLEAQVRDLSNLLGVARAVVSTLDLDKALDSVLTSARQFMEMPAGVLAVFDDKGRVLEVPAHAGLSAEFISGDRWRHPGRGDKLTRRSLLDGQVHVTPDLAAERGNTDPELAREGIKAVVCIPLVLQHRPVGVLYLYDFAPRQFAARQLDHLAVLASFAAMAIDHASSHNRAKQMAITDALTGLYNNRYFKQVFPHELARARRYANPLSLIMLDVDNFKRLNDTYGHPKGDQVLAALGKVLAGSLRSVDLSFRYGGEEFAVLLPETRLESSFIVAENLREKIKRKVSPLLEVDIRQTVTVSLGVAGYPQDCSSPELLLKHADACLYRAKQQGKDRVYWESSDA